MNKPSEKTLRLWLEGELEEERKQEVESWAEAHTDELDAEFKCEIGWDALSDECLASLPASEEPPYPEFFNHKILQSIQEEHGPAQVLESGPGLWQKLRWMIAPTAVAAVAAFYAGSVLSNSGSDNTLAGSQTEMSTSSVYLPNSGIVAAVTETDSATEIVLSGLTPVSDELEIAMYAQPDLSTEAVMVSTESTAGDDAESKPYMLTQSVRDAIYYY